MDNLPTTLKTWSTVGPRLKAHWHRAKAKMENFLWCLNFFLLSLSLVLWSFSLSRSLSLGVIRPFGCIYIRAKATSLPICCIVSNLWVYTTAMCKRQKIKEKIAFAFVLIQRNPERDSSAAISFSRSDNLTISLVNFLDMNSLFVWKVTCSNGQNNFEKKSRAFAKKVLLYFKEETSPPEMWIILWRFAYTGGTEIVKRRRLRVSTGEFHEPPSHWESQCQFRLGPACKRTITFTEFRSLQMVLVVTEHFKHWCQWQESPNKW